MGFSQGDFIRSEKVELKENYIVFTWKLVHADFLFLKSSLR